jgi:hypothetical protein
MNFKFYSDYLVGSLNAANCRGKVFKRYGAGLTYYDMKDVGCVAGLTYHLKPDDVKWVEVTTNDLRPHRDHGVSAVVNLYVDPAGARTRFYKVKEGQVPHAYPGEKISGLYDLSQLEAMDSFVAKRGEAYGLDVTQVHTVTGGTGVRRFVQLIWWTKTLEEIMVGR